MNNIHASNKKKAKPILEELLKKSSSVNWDHKTGAIILRGRPLPRSNIVDIMRHLLYSKKTRGNKEMPSGFNEFVNNVLKMPLDGDFLDYIRNEHMQEFVSPPPPPQIGSGWVRY
jgi:hypothetical protein